MRLTLANRRSPKVIIGIRQNVIACVPSDPGVCQNCGHRVSLGVASFGHDLDVLLRLSVQPLVGELVRVEDVDATSVAVLLETLLHPKDAPTSQPQAPV